MDDRFTLDGREFRGISESLTAAQDDYLLAHLRRSGAIEVLAAAEGPDETRAERLLTEIMLSGETFHILAGCLTETGKKWSRAEAERNAAAFAAITAADEKLRMRAAIVRFVIGFFASGAGSSETSPKSSSPNEGDRPTESADPGTLEISPPSSANSPDTIQAAPTE
ncbi:MAG: hypothetical protein ABSE45_15030 [Candidatus Acidiferrales bacterium]|jgi:hypothetical protein